MIPRESDESQASEVKPEVTEVEDITALKQALVEAEAKAENNLANWQRAQADFINYKRRAEQDREDFNKFANTNLILNLLPILDDMERAFASVPPKLAKLEWMDGIRLIERKLWATLEAQGLSHIEAVGEPFDPHLHEAVRQDKGKEGVVVEEVQKGYRFHDRVIRPARVVVGNGEEEHEKEE